MYIYFFVRGFELESSLYFFYLSSGNTELVSKSNKVYELVLNQNNISSFNGSN